MVCGVSALAVSVKLDPFFIEPHSGRISRGLCVSPLIACFSHWWTVCWAKRWQNLFLGDPGQSPQGCYSRQKWLKEETRVSSRMALCSEAKRVVLLLYWQKKWSNSKSKWVSNSLRAQSSVFAQPGSPSWRSAGGTSPDLVLPFGAQVGAGTWWDGLWLCSSTDAALKVLCEAPKSTDEHP